MATIFATPLRIPSVLCGADTTERTAIDGYGRRGCGSLCAGFNRRPLLLCGGVRSHRPSTTLLYHRGVGAGSDLGFVGYL